MRQLLLLALLLGVVTPAWAQASGVSGPEGVTLSLWQPSQSYPGGTQADPRLDQPVQFWRAGLTLAEVFASVEEQTAVRISFWPPDDQNTRVRVNLYLNPRKPPSLRELMAQLQWVTDCPFSYHRPSESAEPVYELLRTSIGDGVIERLEAEQHAASYAREDAAAQKRRLVADRLDDYRTALSLAPKDVIARYSGRDDMLLLCLLDPSYRAATQLVCSLSTDDLASLFDGRQICRAWEDWTAEQRDYLSMALGFEKSWLDKGPLKIWVAGPDYGYLQIHPWIETTDEFPGPHGGTFRRTALVSGEEMNATEKITLRRALGEQLDEDEAYRKIVELAQEISLQQSRRHQEDYATALRAWPSLSPDSRQKLNIIKLPRNSGASYPLWAVQEAVAAASGLNVVSDCFVQPDRTTGYALGLLDVNYSAQQRSRSEEYAKVAAEHKAELDAMQKRGESPSDHPALRALSKALSTPVSALDWLISLCHPQGERPHMIELYQNDCTGFEWGDAGAFLHFRSVNRDVWRASMLPQDIIEYVDAIIADTVTSLQTDERTNGWVRPTWTLDDQVYLASRLTELQARFGGQQVYEDPTEPGTTTRSSLRRGLVWDAVSESPRFLAALSRSQRQVLSSGGLRWADLTPNQQQIPFAITVARQLTETLKCDTIPKDALFVLRPLRGDPDPIQPECVPDIAVYFLELHWKEKVLFLAQFNARPAFNLSQVRSSLRSLPPLLPLPDAATEAEQ